MDQWSKFRPKDSLFFADRIKALPWNITKPWPLHKIFWRATLVYDRATDRYDIRFDLDRYYGGLHCGECFDVMVGGKWKPTRIEMAADWYLVGIRTDDLQGLRVRM